MFMDDRLPINGFYKEQLLNIAPISSHSNIKYPTKNAGLVLDLFMIRAWDYLLSINHIPINKNDIPILSFCFPNINPTRTRYPNSPKKLTQWSHASPIQKPKAFPIHLWTEHGRGEEVDLLDVRFQLRVVRQNGDLKGPWWPNAGLMWKNGRIVTNKNNSIL